MLSLRHAIRVSIIAIPVIAGCALDEPTDETAAALDDCALPLTIAVSPPTVPATRAGVPLAFDAAVANPNAPGCSPVDYQLVMLDTGILTDPRPAGAGGPPPIRSLPGGETAHVAITATVPASADAGDTLSVVPAVIVPVRPPQVPPPPITATVDVTVAATPGCQISASHELMITTTTVVDDPIRTAFDPASRDPRNGVWTFKHLAEAMARTPRDAPAMVEHLLASLATTQTINGFTVSPRPGISAVLASWPRTAAGELDLARAPLRLQAIVNRLDLRDLANHDAGEGRFVFAFDLPPATPPAPPPQATIILEYKLPAAREHDVARWAHAFHLLGRLPFGEAYNAVLQTITQGFARRGARPGSPNGSAISAVRTNEIPFGDNDVWELREFHLSRATGRLEPSTLDRTPDASFDGTSTLASYLAANRGPILAETHGVPPTFAGQPFQAGAVFNVLATWFSPGAESELRHKFAINTCNGCHAAQETGTVFLHLSPRPIDRPALRSRWLTGTFVRDPETGVERAFDDLGRRKADLASLVCRDEAAIPADTLRKGIGRVH